MILVVLYRCLSLPQSVSSIIWAGKNDGRLGIKMTEVTGIMLWRLLAIKLRKKNSSSDRFLEEKMAEFCDKSLYWYKPAGWRHRGRTAKRDRMGHFSTSILVHCFPVSSGGEEKLRAEIAGNPAGLPAVLQGEGEGNSQLWVPVFYSTEQRRWSTILLSREGVLGNCLLIRLLSIPRYHLG